MSKVVMCDKCKCVIDRIEGHTEFYKIDLSLSSTVRGMVASVDERDVCSIQCAKGLLEEALKGR